MSRNPPRAVIVPQAGSQSLALSCPCNEILYEGTRGPGKTAAQLMRFRRNVGIGYGEFWRGVIFDIEYKNLGDIIAQSKKLFKRFDDGARFLSSPSELKWVWPTGEELLFRYEKNEEGYWNYHGQEYPFIGHNELTKRADEKFYEAMFSCMRSSFRPEDYPQIDNNGNEFLLPPIPLECFSTTNPFGVGHNWVKKRFIDPMPRGTVLRDTIEIENEIEGTSEEITLTRVAIHGSWKENKYLDAMYIAFLMKIKDPNKKAAWVDGSWDITSGGRFDHLWDKSVHLVEPFKIPRSWHVDRAFDWGESKPFSVLWFAESNGDPCIINDKYVKYPKGTIFCVGEYYGGDPEQTNVGLNMTASNVAKDIAHIEKSIVSGDRCNINRGQISITPNICHKINPGPADNAINNKNDENISIADKMSKQGVEWTESDKSPGSRVNGAAVLCEYLEAALEAKDNESGLPERAALYFFNNVRGIVSRFPVLARDTKNTDDVDTQQEDHDYDSLRYRVVNSHKELPKINVNFFN